MKEGDDDEEMYLDVSTLRDRLQEVDVDVDGSRDYLLKRYRKLIITGPVQV